jgi:glyoxylase-like metal-dependent hydrolase (beta-lactamase superfamily II)
MANATPMKIGPYEIDILVQGFPGKTLCHGGLGWSTIALLRGNGRNVLVDVGSFSQRTLVTGSLAERGLTVDDITDVILTHAHWDHSINWVLFPKARIHIGAAEIAWAVEQPWGHPTLPELYIRELNGSKQLVKTRAGDELVPGIVAHDGPGHTPGHLFFLLKGADRDVIFTGDSAKNRAELLTRVPDMSMDRAKHRETFDRIWEHWQARPGNVLIPGHDSPMMLEKGRPKLLMERKGGVFCWFGDTLEQTKVFEFKA